MSSVKIKLSAPIEASDGKNISKAGFEFCKGGVGIKNRRVVPRRNIFIQRSVIRKKDPKGARIRQARRRRL